MRVHDLTKILAALGSAMVSASGCLSQTPPEAPPVIPPLTIPELSPPPIDAPLSPEELPASLPDQCPPPSQQTAAFDEPQVFLATAGALPLIIMYPDYPLNAGDRCISGWAAFRFYVSRDGRITKPKLVTAHPPGVFDRPSLAALKTARWNKLSSLGGCAVFLFHHPLHPLDAETAAAHFPIRCPFPDPVPTIPHGPFPRGPLEAPVPYAIFE